MFFMLRRWGIFLLLASAALARDRIAFIEFYGVKGIDTEAVRRALPFQEGDPYVPYETKRKVRETVRQVTGHDVTEVAAVCCVGDGDQTLFIGLPGQSSKKFAYNPEPKGAVRISEELRPCAHRQTDAGAYCRSPRGTGERNRRRAHPGAARSAAGTVTGAAPA